MKLLAAILTLLILVLQYDLWIGASGMSSLWHLQNTIDAQRGENQQLQWRNDSLAAEVNDLKSGLDAIEERARSELGMVKKKETFVQVIETPANKNNTP